MLVVLPTLTWQALNPVEQNGDGFPDVLPLDPAVGLRRPLAGDGLPRGFGEAAALLGYLDRAHLRYDVRTDQDLLRAGAAALRRYSGVLMAAPERFAPALTGMLRSFTAGGGRVAWIGTVDSPDRPGRRDRSSPGGRRGGRRSVRSASGSGSSAAAARSWCSETGSTSSGAERRLRPVPARSSASTAPARAGAAARLCGRRAEQAGHRRLPLRPRARRPHRRRRLRPARLRRRRMPRG